MHHLEIFFATQEQSQKEYVGSHPAMLDQEKWQRYVNDMTLAAIAELMEFLDETAWKPWSAKLPMEENYQRARNELIDVLHFLVNLMLALDMDADDVLLRFTAKAGINSLRRQTGYDESAKCRVCGRALDDEAVTCRADYCGETGVHP